METPTDMEIVRRVQAGDAEAFGELVNRYSGGSTPWRWPWCAMRSGPRMSRRRLSSERMNTSADFGGASAFATWLYRIAYNRAVGECRRRAYDRIDAESCAVAEESSAGRFDEETVVRMRRALERLRPDERVLVALFYEEERSLAEIAQIMNLTLSNVKVRLHRLRGRLRHYMEE